MANNNNYLESASIGMALMDAVPVLFFCGSVFFIGSIFNSALFMVGAVLCIAAGTCKVLWKMLLAAKGLDAACSEDRNAVKAMSLCDFRHADQDGQIREVCEFFRQPLKFRPGLRAKVVS